LEVFLSMDVLLDYVYRVVPAELISWSTRFKGQM